MGIPIPTIAA